MKRVIPVLLLLLVPFIFAACRGPSPTPAPTSPAPAATPTPTPTPTATFTPLSYPTQATPTPVSTSTLTPTPSPARVEALVTRVVDGDTIEVQLGGALYRVRYIGIDTPELTDSRPEVRALAQEATRVNESLVGGKTVLLEKDVSETDRYGRLLRYVYVGELFVNAELVRLGYAQVATYPPDVKYQELFLELEREARQAGRGLWASVPTPSPTPSPTPTTPTPRTPTPSPTPSATLVPTLTPTATATPITLEMVSVTSSVARGADATLRARTAPGAYCTITVYYKSGPSEAAGLSPKTADAQGNVSWTWRVGTNTTPGSWRIVVTAEKDGSQVSATTYFTVY